MEKNYSIRKEKKKVNVRIVTHARALLHFARLDNSVPVLVTPTDANLEAHVALDEKLLQVPTALAVPRITDEVDPLETFQLGERARR